MVGDEPAQGLAQPGTLVRDDGGVRNWYAKRMAKQGSYGEPIRDTADKTGLRRGLQQAVPPGRRKIICRDGQQGHQNQKARREHAMEPQGPAGLDIRIGFGHRRLFKRVPLFRPTRRNVIL